MIDLAVAHGAFGRGWDIRNSVLQIMGECKMDAMRGKCVAWAILVVGILASVGFAANPVEGTTSLGTEHELKGGHTGFAFNPNTGDVAAIGEEKSMVIYSSAFFDGQSTKVRTIELPVLPSAIAYKRLGTKDHWVIGTAKGDLLLLDATTGKVITRGLATKPIRQIVTADRAEDPAVYAVFAKNSSRSRRSEIACADARDFKSVKEKSLSSSRFLYTPSIALSPDGKRLYCANRSGSPSGVGYVRIEKGPADGSPITFKQGRYEHESISGSYVLGPYNRKMYAGLKCWSAEMEGKEKGAKLPATARCIFRKRPILIGSSWPANSRSRSRRSTSQASILVIHARTLETLGTVKVPKLMASEMGLPKRQYKPAGWFADDRGNRLVVMSPNLAYVLPLSSVKVPDVPYLYPSVKYDAPLRVGKPAQLSVEPVSPGCKLSLNTGPKGMILRDGKLRWTPSDDDLGRIKVTLKVSCRGVDQVTPIWVDVIREGVTLPFVISKMVASPDGDYLVAWGGPTRALRDVAAQPAKIALIHLPTKTVQSTELTANPLAVAVDTHGVYIAMSDRSGMCVLDLKTLKQKQVLLMSKPVTRLFTPVNGQLIVRTQSSDKGHRRGAVICRTYRTKRKLKEDTSVLMPKPFRALPGRIAPALPMLNFDYPWVDGRLNIQHALLKPDASAAELLLGGFANGYSRSRTREPGLGTWGCHVNGTQLMAAGRKVGSVPSVKYPRRGGATRILQNRPVLASVSIASERGSSRERTSLWLLDLISGRIVRKICMIDQALYAHSRQRSMALLCETKTRIIVGKGNRVAFYPSSKIDKKEFPRPLQVLWPRDTRIEIPSTEKVQFKHTAVGGKGKIVFGLSEEAEWLEIDPATGTVIVDAPLRGRQALAALKFTGNFYRLSQPGMKWGTVKQMVDQWTQHSSSFFTGYTGKACNSLVTFVPIHVTATDEEGRLSELKYRVALMTPRSALTVRVKELLAERAKAIAERKAKWDTAQKERAKQSQEGASPSSKKLQDRIRELEMENAALEAQVKLLKELLKEK
jgi:hypothetical protein